MPVFMNFLLRIFLLAAGLVFAISAGIAALLMLAIWGVRAVWARLTGQAISPFIVRINPRQGFDAMYRRSEGESRTPRADSVVQPGRKIPDVTDVEPKSTAQ
jgi:hypothetical protein